MSHFHCQTIDKRKVEDDAQRTVVTTESGLIILSSIFYRFWAEVFLLAQDAGIEGEVPAPGTKWQLVVPKLVPINLARVQDSPATVSHVTAYNTKVDKVMDVLIYHPGK